MSRPFRALAFALALPLAACDAGLETRTFRLEALPPSRAEEMVAPYVWTDRVENPGMMTVTEGALTVRETPDNLERIARVLEEFDRPAEEIRLRFQVIEADGFTGTDAAIADVEEQLRELFRFRGYRLVGEGVLGVGDGGDFSQSLTGGDEVWRVSGTAWRVDSAARLSEVTLWSPPSSPEGTPPTLFETSLNIRAGQTLVLGSARAPGGRGAVILTVRAETVR